jgi:hypothetical protein
MRLFSKEGDFAAFERVIAKTLLTRPMRIVSYCLMSNHWHMVLWPEREGDLAAFMQKLTITHAPSSQMDLRRDCSPVDCIRTRIALQFRNTPGATLNAFASFSM